MRVDDLLQEGPSLRGEKCETSARGKFVLLPSASIFGGLSATNFRETTVYAIFHFKRNVLQTFSNDSRTITRPAVLLRFHVRTIFPAEDKST